MFFLLLTLYFALITKVNSQAKSPCPERFVFEPNRSEEDKWYGLITLDTNVDLNGVNLELSFDKPIIQLGNWFGKVESNKAHTKFLIKNPKKIITANKAQNIEIYVVYDPYLDHQPPQLTRIVLNSREICPNYQEQIVEVRPDIVININFPNCGTTIVTTTPLITHGQFVVQEGQWPWHAALYYVENEIKDYKCGGTLISQTAVLTAAHCVAEGSTHQARDPKKTLIILGKYGLYIIGDNEQLMPVSKILIHSNYNRANLFNDIAIIILQNPAKITDFVKPICLWSEDISLTPLVSRVGTAVGWGRDHLNHAVTDLLMLAKMPVVETIDCIYSNRQFYNLFTNKNNFCAGWKNGTSVCNGDSGGGLVFPKTGTSGLNTIWQLRGIVSNTLAKDGSKTCDPNQYVIFTDVAKFLSWIKFNLG